MRILKRKVGFIVIELGFAPAAGNMALAAFFAQFSLVVIVFGMTGVAGRFGLAILFVLQVATAALGQRVFAFEPEIGIAMIELVLVQPDDAGIATLVVGVAGLAFELARVFIPAVKAALPADVGIDQLVAFPAQGGLRGVAHAHMATGAFGFVLLVPGNQFSRHEHFLDFEG